MRSCVADGQTDGAGYIGPAEGYGGSKKDNQGYNICSNEEKFYWLLLHPHLRLLFLRSGILT